MARSGVDHASETVLQRRYRVGDRIAAGGMGTVHRGWDLRLDRAVALKMLHPHLAEDAEVRARFRAEARHAARVRHTNVVAVLDQDEHGGRPFIVMELVDGPSLRDLLARRTRLPPQEVLRLLAQTCAGLTAVHDVDMVHRDVKPENLLLDAAGRVRVADFGIARALDSTRLTPAGTVMGSVQYLAPEVVLGTPATPASDQYAVGVVLFEMLTGATPLPADVPLAAALRHAREEVPPPSSVWPDVTSAVDRVVGVATAKDPDQRHPSLGALVDAFHRAVTEQGAPDRRSVTRYEPASRQSVRGPASRQPVRGPASPQTRLLASPRPATRRDAARPAPPPRTAAPRATVVRARMSALAVTALAFTLVQVGAVVALILGLFALRRIDRSYGALRGEAVAGLAIIIALARIAGRVLQQM